MMHAASTPGAASARGTSDKAAGRHVVLVTGAYGFVGARVLRASGAARHSVCGSVGAQPGESRRKSSRSAISTQADWESVFERTPDRVRRSPGGARAPDARGDEGAERTPGIAREHQGHRPPARRCPLARVRRFVFASTVKVHGEATPPGIVLRESDPSLRSANTRIESRSRRARAQLRPRAGIAR
jgi:nucleoside-diphosphate-sugar epimerase